ncbi:MAG: helix-turn-helix domain-containing protein [Actinobacteria bacterium]|nr:helix-turn-helix domain-containing protein [Actinomycetota bacterium]
MSEVAERVGACERTVYRALRSGALVGERLGSRWRIRPVAVEAWLSRPADPSGPARSPGPRATPRAHAPPRGKTFTARARARRSTSSAPGDPTTNGGLGAPGEEPL